MQQAGVQRHTMPYTGVPAWHIEQDEKVVRSKMSGLHAKNLNTYNGQEIQTHMIHNALVTTITEGRGTFGTSLNPP